MIRRALEPFDRFFFGRFDPLPAACFRIHLGLLILVSLLANAPNWGRYISLQGMPGFQDPLLGAARAQWWSLLDWFPGVPVPVFGGVGVLLAIGYLVGFRPKVCALGLWLIISGMFFRNWWMSNAEDTAFRMYLFYSFFLPVGDCLSIDQWRRKRRGAAGPLPERRLWPMRMVQFHVVLIYLISTASKWMADELWRTGEAMYYVMINPMWSRWPWPGLFYHAWVSRVATYGSLAVEGCFPFLVWIRPLRPYLVAAMMLFHVLMAVTLQNITFFSLAFSAGLWLFLSADHLRHSYENLRTYSLTGLGRLGIMLPPLK